MGLNLMMWLPDSWNIQPGVYAVVAATAVLAGVFRSSISLVTLAAHHCGTPCTNRAVLGFAVTPMCHPTLPTHDAESTCCSSFDCLVTTLPALAGRCSCAAAAVYVHCCHICLVPHPQIAEFLYVYFEPQPCPKLQPKSVTVCLLLDS